jgi:hypothetical protein
MNENHIFYIKIVHACYAITFVTVSNTKDDINSVPRTAHLHIKEMCQYCEMIVSYSFSFSSRAMMFLS